MNLVIRWKWLAFKHGWVCLVSTNCRPNHGIFQFAFNQTTLIFFQTFIAVISVVLKDIAVIWPKSDISIMHFFEVALRRIEHDTRSWFWLSLSSTSFPIQKITDIDLTGYRILSNLFSTWAYFKLIENCPCWSRNSSSVAKAKVDFLSPIQVNNQCKLVEVNLSQSVHNIATTNKGRTKHLPKIILT